MDGDEKLDWCDILQSDLSRLEYEYEMLDEQYEESLRRCDELLELLCDASRDYKELLGGPGGLPRHQNING